MVQMLNGLLICEHKMGFRMKLFVNAFGLYFIFLTKKYCSYYLSRNTTVVNTKQKGQRVVSENSHSMDITQQRRNLKN